MQRLTKQFKQLKVEDLNTFKSKVFAKKVNVSTKLNWRGGRTLQVSNGGKKIAMRGQITEAAFISGVCY
jgi:shikimate kinase